MFGAFHGLPIHALVLHVAVVFAPLAGLGGIAFLVPKWRRFLSVPLIVVSAVALVTIFVAKESGEDLKAALGSQLTGPGNLSGQLVARHQQLGGELLIAVLVLFVLVLVAAAPHVWLVRNRWRDRAVTLGTGTVGLVAAAVVTVAAVFVLVLTYQTGEAGAKAVWNPGGSFDYSAGK